MTTALFAITVAILVGIAMAGIRRALRHTAYGIEVHP